MSDQTHITDLLPAFVVGSLDADEIRRVEEHLLSCWLCRDESRAFQVVADELSLAAPIAVPSPDLRNRLMQRVHTARPKAHEQVSSAKPARPWLERLLPVWGVASLFLIFALAASSFVLWQRVSQLEFMTAPGGMRAVPLSPPDVASGATGFVLISANGDDGALVVDGLPPLDESQQYQLWLIRNGQRTSGAVFSTDEKSYAGKADWLS